MLSVVSGFIQSRAIIIIATLLVTLGSVLGYTRWQNERLRERNSVLEHNAQVLQDQVAKAEQAIAAVEATGERRQNDGETLRAITQAIREERVTEECVNSPAVQRVLGRMRARRSNVVTAEDRHTGDDEDVP